jgi:hypothetical protein
MTANTQSALAKLLCGDLVSDGGSVDEVLNHLSTSIDNVVEELVALLRQESPNPNKISLFAPFLGRSLLELGCTAMIARLDPFKVLVIREYQNRHDYSKNKPNKSSIRWQGDVLADGVPNLWAD